MTQQARPKPSIPLTADAFADHQETAVYWLASSTILLNSYGTNILMDPTLMFLHDDDQESMVSEVLDDDQIDYMKFLVRPPIFASELPRLDAVLLTPGCSDPLYRRSARVSMGTVFQIPWTFTGDWPGEGMEQLNRLGFRTAAMALSDDSVSIDDRRLMAEEKLAVILGSEGDGLTETTIARCDYTVKIPMYHGVDSLNVAAASAVAFWQLRKEK